MPQSISQPAAFLGDVPPNLTCGFCGQPVKGQFFRTINRFACGNCAAQVTTIMKRNAFAPVPFFTAAAAGLVTAVACAAAWAGIVRATHAEIGIVASFIGVAVAKVIVNTSGKRRGPAMQWLAVTLATIGVVGGKLGLICWQLVDLMRENGEQPTVQNVLQILQGLIQKHPTQIFGAFDLLWIGIAIYAAWRICKAPPITIAGPYAYQPATSGMQFQTIEPETRPPGSA